MAEPFFISITREAEEDIGWFRRVDEDHRTVTVQLVGEKRGNKLFVRGQEFTAPESD